jgi:hypothetical protein
MIEMGNNELARRKRMVGALQVDQQSQKAKGVRSSRDGQHQPGLCRPQRFSLDEGEDLTL